jgi:hypothetical protein
MARQLGSVNLSKPFKRIMRVTHKGLRDRATTVLRQVNLNKAVTARLLGHSQDWITVAYGATP